MDRGGNVFEPVSGNVYLNENSCDNEKRAANLATIKTIFSRIQCSHVSKLTHTLGFCTYENT
jgi:hypothetical protein